MNTREKILKVANKAFAEYGYAGVRVDKLAKETEINKATFYYYFKSKQEVFEEVLKQNIYALQKNLDDKLSFCNNPEEKINTFINVFFSRKREDVLLILREIINGSNNLSDEIIMLMSGIKNCLDEILKEGEKQNVFKKVNSSFVMHLIIGVTDFFVISGPFFKKLKEKKYLINMDKNEFIENLKNVVMNFIEGEKQ